MFPRIIVHEKVLKAILCGNIVVVCNHTLPILAQVVERLTVEVIDVYVCRRIWCKRRSYQ